MSLRVRYLTAAVNFGVTAYATLTLATMRMLHCVRVPGTAPGSRRLFIRGSVECDYTGWQLPYLGLLVVLVAVPLVLPFAAAWSRREGGLYSLNPLERGRGMRAGWREDVRLGVRQAIVDSYSPTTYWWEAALMAQRLILGVVFTFGGEQPGVQAIVLTLLCGSLGYLHLLLVPMRSPDSQDLQAALLFCLTALALSSTSFADSLEAAFAASTGISEAPSASLAARLQLVFGLVVPAAALTWAYTRGRVVAAAKRWRAARTRM